MRLQVQGCDAAQCGWLGSPHKGVRPCGHCPQTASGGSLQPAMLPATLWLQPLPSALSRPPDELLLAAILGVEVVQVAGHVALLRHGVCKKEGATGGGEGKWVVSGVGAASGVQCSRHGCTRHQEQGPPRTARNHATSTAVGQARTIPLAPHTCPARALACKGRQPDGGEPQVGNLLRLALDVLEPAVLPALPVEPLGIYKGRGCRVESMQHRQAPRGWECCAGHASSRAQCCCL